MAAETVSRYVTETHTALAIGNRPSHGAAPTRHISAESTAPWTRRIARPPT